ncbi:MAG: aromatic ring-hydroxylating dioxygenase subunit alpha [Phenylobacterium sp.]|nr:aromatic ring-hydroxylating dioxygenase subunit alpha [Phenylobacterium sp.]
MTLDRNPYAQVADRPEAAIALPGRAYVTADVFAAEQARVFQTGWAPVARTSDVAAPGDYLSVDLFGAPLVVTNDKGTLHVLSRVCRHRGMPVAQGRGSAKALTCPYHLWRYDLDGRLAAAPAMEASDVFDREACALPRLASEIWGGWLFVNLDGQAPPLATRLDGLAERLGRIDPGRMVTADVLTFESPWNWKVMIENFLESYHHIGPHRDSLQRSNPGLATYEGVASDLFTVLENPPADDSHGAFVVAAIFPLTLMFFTQGETPLGVWYELADIEAARFTLKIHLLAPPEFAAVPEFVALYREQVTAIHLEDVPACQGVQQGVASPFYEPGPLSHLERPLWRFHRHLQQAMTQAAAPV